jgi:hypothetical protein
VAVGSVGLAARVGVLVGVLVAAALIVIVTE